MSIYQVKEVYELKYMKAMIEVTDLEMEDVVLTSGGGCNADGECELDGIDCTLMA